MRYTYMGRKQVVATHLLISLVIFLVMLYLIMARWYPSFFLTLDGGLRGIATIFFVDMVLGPGLTTLIYRPGKPGLKFDITVIVIIQLAALYWGVSKVYEDRSATAVFYLGKFSCLGVSSSDGVKPEIISGAGHPQKLSLLERPDSMESYNEMLRKALKAGKSEIYHYGSLFEAIDRSNVHRVMSYRLNIADLKNMNVQDGDLVERYAEKSPGYMVRYGLYPLTCRFGDAIAVFDFERMKIIETLPLMKSKSMLRAESLMPMK